jgi:pimeloyl-ACP methyl ester carboxylesterase
MAAWVFEVLNSLHIQKAGVVGHSMGSLIAAEFAARQPQAAERIAMIGAAHPMKVSGAFLDAARRNHYSAFDMHTIWGHAAQVPLGGNPNPGMWMYGDTQARLERLAPGVLYNDLKASNDYVLSGEVKCPALFILGKRDVMTPPKAARGLQEKIASSKTVSVDFSGHSLMAEAPDATLDALIEFFHQGADR